MRTRLSWIEIAKNSSAYNFKWQPISKGIKFCLLGNLGYKQVIVISFFILLDGKSFSKALCSF